MRTGRTLQPIAAAHDIVWLFKRAGGGHMRRRTGHVPSGRRGHAGKGGSAAGPLSSLQGLVTLVAGLPGARRGALPRTPRAQLATLVAAAPDGPEWLHEI